LATTPRKGGDTLLYITFCKKQLYKQFFLKKTLNSFFFNNFLFVNCNVPLTASKFYCILQLVTRVNLFFLWI